MTAIWQQDCGGWRLLNPSGFVSEADLHNLVEASPQLLPLSGAPSLVVMGREVALSTGYADLIAIETSGRIVVIEVKLAANAEARRAVVAQTLAYAAALHRMPLDLFEGTVLAPYLASKGYADIASAVVSAESTNDFDAADFRLQVAACLQSGSFRLVIVLDDAPPQLQQLVGYLESITEGLVIDLITVSSFDVGGIRLVVPQRVSPERDSPLSVPPATKKSSGSVAVPQFSGSEEFQNRISRAADSRREFVLDTLEFARDLERRGLAKLVTRTGQTYTSLNTIPKGYDAGLFVLYHEVDPELNRSVLARLAPRTAEQIDEHLSLTQIGKQRCGITPATFGAIRPLLAAAYEEANARHLPPSL